MAELPDFAALYREHLPRVRRLLSRFGVADADLDDAVHEAFITIHRQLPEFEGRAKLETWIHAIVWRVAAGQRRRAHHRREVQSADPAPPPEDAAAQALGTDDLHASLGCIDDEARDLIALHEVGGLSTVQLSELTGLARATIAERLNQARLMLGRTLSTSGRALGSVSPDELLMPAGPGPGWGTPRRTTWEIVRPGYCYSRVGDCVVQVIRVPSTLEQNLDAADMLLSVAEDSQHGVAYLAIVEGSSAPPDRAGRQAMGWI
jgi:RNA polymerase sigma-70 factor (ECF subfamily)